MVSSKRTKHTINEPAFDAYFIDKSVVPNIIRFSAPPIWDQDLSARTIGEPTQVEKFFATGVGNQKRYTIDDANIDGETTGPHQIVSIAEDTILNIDDERFLLVILNGVIQKEDYLMVVLTMLLVLLLTSQRQLCQKDVLLTSVFSMVGDIEPTVTLHNYDINGYLYPKELTVTGPNAGSLFNNFVVTSDYALTTYENFYFYESSNGVYPLGKAYDWRIVGSNTLKVKLFTNIDFDAKQKIICKNFRCI